MNECQVLIAMEARYEERPLPLSASLEAILEAMDQLRGEAVALLGRGEMQCLFKALNLQLEGVNAPCLELEEMIAANVAGILEV